MIVRGLRAEGFMRFEQLELTDLPGGVIAVLGENESGKSTIGEAIAFSLFGRTIRTEDTDPTQAIHWDVDECKTAIDVELPGRGLHRVERRVARTGEFEARLLGPGGELLAQGARAVNEALFGLLGYDFSAFRYSFYVAQGELDLIQKGSKDNATRVVSDMLGISTIERAASALEAKQAELRERSSMLDRDLIVANALHTECLPIRDEIEVYEEQLEQATASQRGAQAEEQRATEAYLRWEKASQAQRDWTQAMTRLEGSLAAEALQQRLLSTRGRLHALVQRGEEAERQTQSALAKDAQPRDAAKAALDKAEAIARDATKLEALVAHHHAQLARATAISGDADSIPARQAREGETQARERKTITLSTVALVIALLLTLTGGGLAAAWHLPQEKPLLAPPPATLEIPRIGFALTSFTAKRASMIAGAAAGVFLLLTVWSFLRRSGAKRRLQEAEGEQGRLDGVLAQDLKELEACREFTVGPLNAVSQRLAPVSDDEVKNGLKALIGSAGTHADGDATPTQVLERARKRLNDLDENQRLAEPRLAEARRIVDLAKQALADAEGALAGRFEDGLPEPTAPEGDLPKTAEDLVKAIGDAAAVTAQARIELDAVTGGGQVVPVDEPARELQAAIDLGLQALPGGQDKVRASYEEQTGLPQLLKSAGSTTTEAIRAVIKRERELLDDVFGDEQVHRKQLREVEDQLRVARVQKAAAEAELAEAQARGARVSSGRKRLAELEAKIAGLEEVLRPTQRELAVHEEAIQLLRDLAQALKERFGPGIARYVEVVLPRLTNGRYKRTRIGDDLDIRVYSPERGDFVRLIELSLGTADQILVSLRLGLARALLASRGIRGGHFLFMDEPLVSADESREQAFFDLLRTFDQEFAQIFVSSPRRLSQDGPFAKQLELRRDTRVLRSEAGARA